MLTKHTLEKAFGAVLQLDTRLFRTSLELPNLVHYFYFKTSLERAGRDYLLPSRGCADDAFAVQVLHTLPALVGFKGRLISDLPPNPYGFSNALLLGDQYYDDLTGLLDKQRPKLVRCIPFHRSEFSGAETANEILVMRLRTIRIDSWSRTPSPKIMLRFENPKTRGGTSSAGVLSKADTLSREIANLEGVKGGFIEIKNYKGEVMMIQSPTAGSFSFTLASKHQESIKCDRRHVDSVVKQFLLGL